MKAISLHQPWAWAILHAGKNVENRSWQTNFRGRILLHASKAQPAEEYIEAVNFMEGFAQREIPSLEAMRSYGRGGIVGSVEIVDCVPVEECDSPWAVGPFCWLLRKPRITEFVPCRGNQRIWTPYQVFVRWDRELDGYTIEDSVGTRLTTAYGTLGEAKVAIADWHHIHPSKVTTVAEVPEEITMMVHFHR